MSILCHTETPFEWRIGLAMKQEAKDFLETQMSGNLEHIVITIFLDRHRFWEL